MVYERMKERLAPVKAYADGAQVLSFELKAYATEIERLYDALSVMFRERFITTAEDAGLSVYEELFGPDRSGESTVRRRELLYLRMNLGENDFTPAGMRKALDSLGLEYVISEFPALQRLVITATADYSAAEQAWIRREVGKLVPAHLGFQLTFNTLTWAQWDALDRTFGAIDSENRTWSEIDERTA